MPTIPMPSPLVRESVRRGDRSLLALMLRRGYPAIAGANRTGGIQ